MTQKSKPEGIYKRTEQRLAGEHIPEDDVADRKYAIRAIMAIIGLFLLGFLVAAAAWGAFDVSSVLRALLGG